MFTEQPAPPHPVADVQVQQADATVAQPPDPAPVTPARSATPEVIVVPVPAPPAAPAPPAPTPAPPPAAVVQPITLSTNETAKAQRQQEVEQALLELTSKARAQQREQQEQQAAAETAKYAEADEVEEAQKIINNPALPANVRAALLKQLQAKQAKKGRQTLITKKATLTKTQVAKGSAGNVVVNPGYSVSARDYSSAPIVPLSQAQMRLRLGQLFGRNLNFVFPLSIPAPITSMFGWRIHPISGSPRFHRGIDFGAPIGTPIVAAKAGRVQAADSMDGYGLTVIVQHGAAYQTLYAHMSQIFVQPGETVKKGQLLGLVGSTGNSTGPHLHFEVHEMTTEGWVALDPAIALNGAIAIAQNAPILNTSSKPRTFNLAMSGLLDINPPPQTLTTANFGSTVLSSLMPSTTATASLANGVTPDEMQLPLTLLPPAIPELDWLISPFLANLAAELTIPLPGLDTWAQPAFFSAVPALAEQPKPGMVSSQPAAFNPTAKLSVSAPWRVAESTPLAGLAIAATPALTAQFPPQPKRPAVPTQPVEPVLTNSQRLSLSGLASQRLQLNAKRIRPLADE